MPVYDEVMQLETSNKMKGYDKTYSKYLNRWNSLIDKDGSKIYSLARLPLKVTDVQSSQQNLKPDFSKKSNILSYLRTHLRTMVYHSFQLPDNVTKEEITFFNDHFSLPFRRKNLNVLLFILTIISFFQSLIKFLLYVDVSSSSSLNIEFIKAIFLSTISFLTSTVLLFLNLDKLFTWFPRFIIFSRNLKQQIFIASVSSLLLVTFFMLTNLPWIPITSEYQKKQLSEEAPTSRLFLHLETVCRPGSLITSQTEDLMNSNVTIWQRLFTRKNNAPPISESVYFSSLLDYHLSNLDEGVWAILFGCLLIHGCIRSSAISVSFIARILCTLFSCTFHSILVAIRIGFCFRILSNCPGLISDKLRRAASSDSNIDGSRGLARLFHCPMGAFQLLNLDSIDSLWTSSLLSIGIRTIMGNLVIFVLGHLVSMTVSQWTECQIWRLLYAMRQGETERVHLKVLEQHLSKFSRELVPKPLCDDLKRDFRDYFAEWSSPLVIYLRNVSFLLVESVGLSQAMSRSNQKFTTTTQAVNFLSNLFTKMDELVKTHGCYQLKAHPDEYLCLAGYPELRVDHAKICIELALALHNLINSIAEQAKVNLAFNICVNTGAAYAAVFGRSRISYDVIGDDVVILHRMLNVTKPGRILVTRSTFDQLPEGYRGESGPFLEPVSRRVDPNDLQSCNMGAVLAYAANINIKPINAIETFFVQSRSLKNKTPQSSSHYLSLYDTNRSAVCISRLSDAIIKLFPELSGLKMGLAYLIQSYMETEALRSELIRSLNSELSQEPPIETQLKLANSQSNHNNNDDVTSFASIPQFEPQCRPLIDLDQLPWPNHPPIGLLRPHFITLAFHPMDIKPKQTDPCKVDLLTDFKNIKSQKNSDSTDQLEQEQERMLALMRLDENTYHNNQRPRLIISSLVSALFLLIGTFLVHILLLPRRILFYLLNLLTMAFIILCISLHVFIKVFKRFDIAAKVSGYWIRITLHFLVTILVSLVNIANLYNCQFTLWAVNAHSTSSANFSGIVPLAPIIPDKIVDPTSTSDANHCPLPGYVSIICCVVAMLSLVICSPPTISQALRTATVLTLATFQLVTITIVLDTQVNTTEENSQNRSFHSSINYRKSKSASSIDVTMDQEQSGNAASYFLGYFLQHCLAQLAFAGVALFLPRTLDYLNRLTYLWKIQFGFNTIERQSYLDGIARLLLSLLPRHILSNTLEKTHTQASNANQFPAHSDWLAMISVRIHQEPFVSSDSKTEKKSEDVSEDIKLTAERVRRTNNLFCYIDSITCANPQPVNARSLPRFAYELKSYSELNATFPGIQKVYNSGNLAIFTIDLENSMSFSTENRIKQMQLLQTFAEHLVSVCSILNQNHRSETKFFLRFGLHGASCISGVVGRNRPEFGLWGEGFTKLRLLSLEIEHQTSLNNQHYMISTPEAYNLLQYPSNSDLSQSGWICFDSKTAKLKDVSSNIYANNAREALLAEDSQLYFRLYQATEPIAEPLKNSITEHLVCLATILALKKNAKRKISKASSNISNKKQKEDSINIPPPLPPHQKSYSGELNRGSTALLEINEQEPAGQKHAKKEIRKRLKNSKTTNESRHSLGIFSHNPRAKMDHRISLANIDKSMVTVNQVRNYETDFGPLKMALLSKLNDSDRKQQKIFILSNKEIEDATSSLPVGISHHNPLYTDNEYDSMSESQTDVKKRTRKSDDLINNNTEDIKLKKRKKAYSSSKKHHVPSQDIHTSELHRKPSKRMKHRGRKHNHQNDFSVINQVKSVIEHVNAQRTDNLNGHNEVNENLFAYHGSSRGEFFFKNPMDNRKSYENSPNKLRKIISNEDTLGYLIPDHKNVLCDSQEYSAVAESGINDIVNKLRFMKKPVESLYDNCVNSENTPTSEMQIQLKENVQFKSEKNEVNGYLKETNNSAPNSNIKDVDESDSLSGYNGDASIYTSDEEKQSHIVKNTIVNTNKLIRFGKHKHYKSSDKYTSLGQRSQYDNITDHEEYSNVQTMDNFCEDIDKLNVKRRVKNQLAKSSYPNFRPYSVVGGAAEDKTELKYSKRSSSTLSLVNLTIAEDKDNGKLEEGLLRLRQRAEKVRSLLPPQLAQFVLPVCVSSESDEGPALKTVDTSISAIRSNSR